MVLSGLPYLPPVRKALVRINTTCIELLSQNCTQEVVFFFSHDQQIPLSGLSNTKKKSGGCEWFFFLSNLDNTDGSSWTFSISLYFLKTILKMLMDEVFQQRSVVPLNCLRSRDGVSQMHRSLYWAKVQCSLSYTNTSVAFKGSVVTFLKQTAFEDGCDPETEIISCLKQNMCNTCKSLIHVHSMIFSISLFIQSPSAL